MYVCIEVAEDITCVYIYCWIFLDGILPPHIYYVDMAAMMVFRVPKRREDVRT